jgi:hypothetical protein
VTILREKGITESNKTNIAAMASAMETFGDFKRSASSWNVGKEGVQQLIAITKLLREAATLQANDNRPATNSDLQKAIKELKESITPTNGLAAPNPGNINSYANAAKRALGGNPTTTVGKAENCN